MIAPTLLTGDEANSPPKYRVIRTDCMFLLVAVPIENNPTASIGGSKDTRRPQSSDSGAQQRGPNANPRLISIAVRIIKSLGTLWVKDIDQHVKRDAKNRNLMANAKDLLERRFCGSHYA